MKYSISCCSEDGASVYEVYNQDGKKIDSLYIGADDWRYGDKIKINKEISEFKAKYEAAI